MPRNRTYDLIIVGAGPAGISTALHLARIAPELVSHTLILEKARHPRPKLCGGGLLPDGEVILHNLGLDLDEVPHVDVDWAHFDYAGRGFRMRAEKKGTCAFRTIRRPEFDAWLAARARARGYSIQEDTCLEGLTVTGSEVLLVTDHGDYRARVVVGADGSSSTVRRALPRAGPFPMAYGLEVMTEFVPERTFHLARDSYFDFEVLPHGILGYTWDFPVLEQGRSMRVRGVYDCRVHPVQAELSLKGALSAEMQRHGLSPLDTRPEGSPIHRFQPHGTFAAAHLLLVGDAAGADGLYGEGLSFALGYGYFAARAIQAAFTRQDFSFQEYQSDILGSAMGKALQRRAWLAGVFYLLRSRRLQAFIWRGLGPVITGIVHAFLTGWARREDWKIL